jgi:molybdopterin converting factor small subunit
MITVNLNGVFQVETGVKTFELDDVEGITAGKAVLAIISRYPVLHKFWVTEDGGLSEHVLMVLNGKEIYAHPDGLRTVLMNDDRLDFFSPLAGG